jgi:FKBP-type peptidyl-prolyl cis-trans isomerase
MIHRLAPGLALLTLTACAHIGLQQRPVEMQRNAFTTTSGLRSEDLFLGRGHAAEIGDSVTFDYTAWLENGDRVDSTLDRGVPLTVALGTAPLRGLDEGLIGMKSGGRRRLTMPPELAYGSEGVEDMIPPNATLIFEVHMIEVSAR